MKVVQVVPSLDLGGVERGTLEIGRALVSSGHESIVFSNGGRLVEQLEQEGSRHVFWNLGKKSLLTLLKVWSVRRWLEEERPDIIHARSRMPAWVVWLAWRGMDPVSRPKFITTLHGMHSINWYSSIMGRGEKVIAVSETAKRYLLDNFPSVDESRVTVIHRGIDPAEFPRGYQPTKEWTHRFFSQYPSARGKRLICFPGRITRWKGHLDLVKVIKSLSRKRSDFHVLIVGNDSKNKFINEVKNTISEANLDSFFTFTGTRSDMKDLYAISDVMLSLTSTTAEAFGRTVVECLAIGTPVVGYAHGAVAETLSAMFKAGLVERGDIRGAVSRIEHMLAADQHIEPLAFQLSVMQSETLKFYREVLDES